VSWPFLRQHVDTRCTLQVSSFKFQVQGQAKIYGTVYYFYYFYFGKLKCRVGGALAKPANKYLTKSFPALLAAGLQPGGIERRVANPPRAVRKISENLCPSTYCQQITEWWIPPSSSPPYMLPDFYDSGCLRSKNGCQILIYQSRTINS